MNIDPNSPAFPRTGNEFISPQDGLTIRQHFAAMAMQGIITQLADIGALKATMAEAKQRGISLVETVAMSAVEHADALIAELNIGESAMINRLRNIPEEERMPFLAWLTQWGCTVPTLPDTPESEQDAFFIEDYERWREGKTPLD